MKIFPHILVFVLSNIVFISCGNKNANQNTIGQKNVIQNKSNKEEIKPHIDIAGVYTGRDNLDMESTIIIQDNGTLITQSSIGDGTPDVGTWVGTAENLKLYTSTHQLIASAEISTYGLKIKGGKFYTRK